MYRNVTTVAKSTSEFHLVQCNIDGEDAFQNCLRDAEQRLRAIVATQRPYYACSQDTKLNIRQLCADLQNAIAEKKQKQQNTTQIGENAQKTSISSAKTKNQNLEDNAPRPSRCSHNLLPMSNPDPDDIYGIIELTTQLEKAEQQLKSTVNIFEQLKKKQLNYVRLMLPDLPKFLADLTTITDQIHEILVQQRAMIRIESKVPYTVTQLYQRPPHSQDESTDLTDVFTGSYSVDWSDDAAEQVVVGSSPPESGAWTHEVNLEMQNNNERDETDGIRTKRGKFGQAEQKRTETPDKPTIDTGKSINHEDTKLDKTKPTRPTASSRRSRKPQYSPKNQSKNIKSKSKKKRCTIS